MLFFGISIAVLAVFVGFFIFGYFLFLRACGRKDVDFSHRNEHNGGRGLSSKQATIIEDARTWFDAQSFESLAICSYDGLRLYGRILPSSEAKGVILFFHGYHSAERRDFAIQAKTLHEAGYHLLLVSERAHGKSEGKYSCFGVKERQDVLSWVALAQRRFPDLPIALFGLSMGGTSVLMSAGLTLPSSVKVLIADCPFSSPWEIIARTLRYQHKIFPYPAIYFMNYWARMLAGFDFRECDTPQALRSNQRPTLLIHGKDDFFVPPQMSICAKDANAAPTELLLVDGARHGQAILFATEEYLSRLLSFLNENL